MPNPLRDALSFAAVEELHSDTPGDVVWADFPEIRKSDGERVDFMFKDYCYNADEYYVNGELNTTGSIEFDVPVGESGTEFIFAIRGVNSKTRVYKDTTLKIIRE